MGDLVSPLPGLVATVHVSVGDVVSAGDPVVTLQSMKMEIPVGAEESGTVEAILVEEGVEIDTGAPLVRIS
ncbi:MAG: biotin/lipoyl-containing protein [Thermomicrobiales bacterium]